MARSIPDDRLERLVDVATEVFVEQGYRRTQMADVAEALGVAKGTIYLYVESKEALFDFALRHADAPRPLARPPRLPIPTPRSGATLRFVREKLERSQAGLGLLRAAAGPRSRVGVADLERIVGELYDVLAANRRGIKLLDRSARDYPELAELWFAGARTGLIELLARQLEAGARSGGLRRMPDAVVAARMVIETAVFWAVHRHWDRHPQQVADEIVRESVVRFAVGALAKQKQEDRA